MATRHIPQETDPLLLRPREPSTQNQCWLSQCLDWESLVVDNNGSTARDQLGYERTYLAWIRFAIVLVSFGASMLCHSDEKSPHHFYPSLGDGSTFLISIFYLFIGIVTVLMALFSYLLIQYTHATTRLPIPPRQSMTILFTIIATTTTIVTVYVLYYESAQR
ncbi:hypothetical protein K7432_010250 [Basidiobolus ranarum]|uniref:DUF202 domain-containing protein n=1 Tax=Basidiobolus ranarum TaxID=34480 RepID=A0ABR2VWK0_9FUNG